jgi:signal transduction histidine kinase
VVDLPRLAPTGAPEIDRLVDALNSTGERLSAERRRTAAAERLAALGRMSAGLAHEIRNPIAAMRLKAENALAVADGSRSEAALKTILQQVGRLDALLRDLLEMTQANEPRLQDVDLPDFLANTIETHRDLAVAKGISLTAGTGPASTPLPRFDPSQMQRALDNLIINAIQYTPAGGSIAVAARRKEDMLLLRVEDSGPGVADEVRERLFEPFVTGRADGTGLGLAIVREIARHHHGDVHLIEIARGAIFEIEVPWQPS